MIQNFQQGFFRNSAEDWFISFCGGFLKKTPTEIHTGSLPEVCLVIAIGFHWKFTLECVQKFLQGFTQKNLYKFFRIFSIITFSDSSRDSSGDSDRRAEIPSRFLAHISPCVSPKVSLAFSLSITPRFFKRMLKVIHSEIFPRYFQEFFFYIHGSSQKLFNAFVQILLKEFHQKCVHNLLQDAPKNSSINFPRNSTRGFSEVLHKVFL